MRVLTRSSMIGYIGAALAATALPLRAKPSWYLADCYPQFEARDFSNRWLVTKKADHWPLGGRRRY